jgi:hypothetical protein
MQRLEGEEQEQNITKLVQLLGRDQSQVKDKRWKVMDKYKTTNELNKCT